MVSRGWLPLLTLLAAVLTVSSQELSTAQTDAVPSGNASVPPSVTDAPVSLSSTSLPVNASTAAPVTGTTEDPEKPITEQIRTYIEDSVKSVKSAISKIGKFVGEFFDQDGNSNATLSANSSTAVSSTPGPSTLPPTSSLPPPTTSAP